MGAPGAKAVPRQPIAPAPVPLAKDVVPASIAEAVRTLGRELAGTVRAYLRMIGWPKDVSWKQVTLASIDRIGYALVGVAVAVARGRKRLGQARAREPGATARRD